MTWLYRLDMVLELRYFPYTGGAWSQMTNWKPAWISVFCHSLRDFTGNPHMNLFFFLVRRKLVFADTKPEGYKLLCRNKLSWGDKSCKGLQHCRKPQKHMKVLGRVSCKGGRDVQNSTPPPPPPPPPPPKK